MILGNTTSVGMEPKINQGDTPPPKVLSRTEGKKAHTSKGETETGF